MLSESYDVVVIGCGVSGMCVASQLNTNMRALIVEHGKPHNMRDHDNATESLIGGGGAGLFSDGKFSFYPAGTAVWNIEKIKLQESYTQLIADLTPYLHADVLTEITNYHHGHQKIINEHANNLSGNEWFFKKYASHYLTLNQRIHLLNRLHDRINCKIIYNHLVADIRKHHENYTVTVKDCITNSVFTVNTKYIVYAGGRLMSLYFKNTPQIFRRIEYGARIVASSDVSDMQQENITDAKFILRTKDFEARTFCWCKNGEIVHTDNAQGVRTWSGRADNMNAVHKNESNFGLNIRVLSENTNHLKKILHMPAYTIYPNACTKSELKSVLKTKMGSEYGKYFYVAFKMLLRKFHTLAETPTLRIVGPTVEGVGDYPDIDCQTLQIVGENIYCCGDATGIFRGIVASMISGYFVAKSLNNLFV